MSLRPNNLPCVDGERAVQRRDECIKTQVLRSQSYKDCIANVQQTIVRVRMATMSAVMVNLGKCLFSKGQLDCVGRGYIVFFKLPLLTGSFHDLCPSYPGLDMHIVLPPLGLSSGRAKILSRVILALMACYTYLDEAIRTPGFTCPGLHLGNADCKYPAQYG